MTLPANEVYVDGGAAVSADNLNTLVQLCPLASDLRAFVGVTNMCVVLFGINAANDGGQGFFRWADGTGTDDNNNVIVPLGQTEGYWLRVNYTLNAGNSLTFATGADNPLTIGQDATSPTRSMISLSGNMGETGAVGIWGGATLDNGILFVGAPNAIQMSLGGVAAYQFAFGTFFPEPDNGKLLGDPANRWNTVWAVNGTIQTSDIRDKHEIEDTALGLEFVEKLRPIRWRWREGDDQRAHHGFAAQQLAEALGGHEFGGLHQPDDAPHGINYSELIAPLVKAVQELSARVKELEAGRAPDQPANGA